MSLHVCHNEPYFISDGLKLLITHPLKNRTANICTYFSDEGKLVVLRKRLFNEQSQELINPMAGLLQIILTTQIQSLSLHFHCEFFFIITLIGY